MSKTSYARAQAQIKSKLQSGEIGRLAAIKELYDVMPDHVKGLKEAKELVDKWEPYLVPEQMRAQRQDSLKDQMITVVRLAEKAGCYDAADWIKKRMGWN